MSNLALFKPKGGIPQRGLVARYKLGSNNLLQYSEAMSTSPWTQVSTTFTGDLAVPATATGVHVNYQQITATSTNTWWTVKVRAKQGGYPNLRFVLYGTSTGSYADVRFDLSAGTVYSSINAGLAPGNTSITAVGDGSYDCQASFQIVSDTKVSLRLDILDNAGNTAYAGDGSSGIHLIHAQLNEGSTALPYTRTDSLQTIPNLGPQHYNLLPLSEDLTNGTWSKLASGTGTAPVITANAGTAPDGTNTAFRVQMNKGAGTTTSDYSRFKESVSNSGIPVGGTACESFWAKSNDGNTYTVQFRDDAALSLVGTTVSITPQWQQFSVSGVTTNVSFNHGLWLRGGQGTSDSCDILFWHPMLNIGSSPASYEATTSVAPTYDPASGRSGFHLQRGSTTGSDSNDPVQATYYQKGDGVDDYLVASLPMPSTYRTLVTIMSTSVDPGTTLIASQIKIGSYDGVSPSTGTRIISSEFYGSQKTVYSSAVPALNTPYFVASVRGPSQFEQYVGLDKKSTVVSGDPSQLNPYPFYALSSAGSNAFSGNVYEQLVYNVALTQAEVSRLYRALKAEYAGKGISI